MTWTSLDVFGCQYHGRSTKDFRLINFSTVLFFLIISPQLRRVFGAIFEASGTPNNSGETAILSFLFVSLSFIYSLLARLPVTGGRGYSQSGRLLNTFLHNLLGICRPACLLALHAWTYFTSFGDLYLTRPPLGRMMMECGTGGLFGKHNYSIFCTIGCIVLTRQIRAHTLAIIIHLLCDCPSMLLG
jgi:hypothetical protein